MKWKAQSDESSCLRGRTNAVFQEEPSEDASPSEG